MGKVPFITTYMHGLDKATIVHGNFCLSQL